MCARQGALTAFAAMRTIAIYVRAKRSGERVVASIRPIRSLVWEGGGSDPASCLIVKNVAIVDTDRPLGGLLHC